MNKRSAAWQTHAVTGRIVTDNLAQSVCWKFTTPPSAPVLGCLCSARITLRLSPSQCARSLTRGGPIWLDLWMFDKSKGKWQREQRRLTFLKYGSTKYFMCMFGMDEEYAATTQVAGLHIHHKQLPTARVHVCMLHLPV